jgi:hypothetical protein
MGFRTRLAGGEFTFFSRLSATGGAPYRQGLFLGDFHGYIMRVYLAARWSILTIAKGLLVQDRHCITPAF